jgi:hypothetical protein
MVHLAEIHPSYITYGAHLAYGASLHTSTGSTLRIPNSIKPMWKQWVNALLGLGTIVVPFLGLTGSALTSTLVIMGAIILILSIWTTTEVSRDEYEEVVSHHRHSHA